LAKDLQKPLELAALKGRLERARKVEASIGEVGARYDKVLGAIEEKRDQALGHVGSLEVYDSELAKLIREMTGESNIPPQEAAGLSTNGAGTETDKQ